MKRTLPFLILFFVAAMALAAMGPTKLYKGDWFEVRYPAAFTPAPFKDGAAFRSPDGAVTFFVFSPQWDGTPSLLLPNAATEVVIASEEKGPARYGTVRAKDGAYERAYMTETVEGQTRKAFAVQYASKAAFDRYRKEYLAFKASHKQFAD